jgi:hypothetical protein
MIKVLKTKKFSSIAYKETAYGIVENYGQQQQTMKLMRVDKSLLIEWVVGDNMDSAEIGIEAVGMDIVGYDGVFEIPKQAIELLKEAGFNTKEIEEEESCEN